MVNSNNALNCECINSIKMHKITKKLVTFVPTKYLHMTNTLFSMNEFQLFSMLCGIKLKVTSFWKFESHHKKEE